MSVMQIKHRSTCAVLYEGEAQSLRELVERAVAGGADLGGANLSGANLGGVIGITRATAGWLRRYGWSCVQHGPTDPLLLRYGCELHPLEAWTDDLIGQLCAKHAPGDAALPVQLRALVQFCKAVQL